MMINGCMIISKLDKDSVEGLASTVEKDGVKKGPFATVQEAVECAHAWETEPKPIPVEEIAKHVEPDPVTEHSTEVVTESN